MCVGVCVEGVVLLDTCFVTEDRVKYNFLSIKVTVQEKGTCGFFESQDGARFIPHGEKGN